MSAMKAGMSRNTARKYLRQNNVMERRRRPHTWRTRCDPLEGVWPRALEMLREAPELEAKALFEHLRQSRPGQIGAGLLRTFQRRVRRWRLAEGAEKEVFFTQDHKPGEQLAVDWTEMGSLKITIEGRAFEHKLFHGVLPYSNWEWAVRARSESTLSLRGGLNALLGRLGRVPRQLLTDHSSTATHQLGREGVRRGFNQEYLRVCAHFGLEPRTINVSRPQENGDCESSHGHLKRRLHQHLLLRGSRDFASEQEYDRFLAGVLESANQLRRVRLQEELAAMREVSIEEVPDYRELMVSVGTNSTMVAALRELHRVLKPGGILLAAFHIGDDTVHLDEWWGHEVSVDFHFLQPGRMRVWLETAGFEVEEVIERDPYPDMEHKSRRAYIFARRTPSTYAKN